MNEDIKQKIEYESNERIMTDRERGRFQEGGEYGYSLAQSEIEKKDKEIERMKIIAHEYAEAGRKEMERVDGLLAEIERLKGLIEKLVKDDNMFHIGVQDSYKEKKWQEFQKINQL